MPDFDGIHHCPISRPCETLHCDRTGNLTSDNLTTVQRVRTYVATYRYLAAKERKYNSRSTTPDAILWQRASVGTTDVAWELDEAGFYGLSNLLRDEADATDDGVTDVAARNTADIDAYLENLSENA